MINVFLNEFHLTNMIVSIILMLVLNAFFAFFWPKLQKKFSFMKEYDGVQRVHEGEVSRMGGLVCYCGLLTYYLLSKKGIDIPFLETILLSSIPLMMVSLKEDLSHNTSVTQRLLGMLITVVLFFYLYPLTYPVIDFPIIGDVINHSTGFSLIFFVFATLAIMNGTNLIDGANGLMPMTVVMQCISLFYLAYIINDIDTQFFLLCLLIPLMTFMFFNYPWGKIFMGDFGAYFYGFLVAIMTIIFFGKHPELPTWGAILILFYPAFELIFSIIRKKVSGLSPTEPDSNHLHLKMYYLLRSKVIKRRVSNGMVMPCLALIWGLPFTLTVLSNNSLSLTIISIVCISVIYLGFFWALPKSN